MSESIISDLASFQAPNVFNPWRDSDELDLSGEGPYGRRRRLELHFDCRPNYLLIGEAPGYQGCHFSGIPFTNESLLMNGAIPRIGYPGRITSRDRPWSEPSASIVWRELYRLGIAEDTVLWNAFAWHPHKPGDPMSNRAPTHDELLDGRYILKEVIDYFAYARIIAVGRVAERALEKLGLTPDGAVRHPSMGGAVKFREGLKDLACMI